jgi:Flp pilus assembly protein TadG
MREAKMIAFKFIAPALAKASAAIEKLRKAKEGVAAVEFAMVLPVMVGMYLGCCEVSSGFSASKKVNAVARALSDLTAQSSAAISQTQMNDLVAAATGVMQPFDGSVAKLTLSSIIMPTPAGGAAVKAYTDWSYIRGGTAMVCGDVTTSVPPGFLSGGHSVIKADVTYTYLPLLAGPFHSIGNGSTTGIDLAATVWMQPRILPRVQLANGVPGTCAYSPAKTFP